MCSARDRIDDVAALDEIGADVSDAADRDLVAVVYSRKCVLFAGVKRRESR